ncbi:unnamed protein product [Callosobruchus maculatus]|uniref:Uncharacterized protein n=1 Tax=Callosobruchus maculatus TaxID=64391 RepID=A0A653CD55_CALMS|nr:unnamed protein product [Callosobruchus maculatus]
MNTIYQFLFFNSLELIKNTDQPKNHLATSVFNGFYCRTFLVRTLSANDSNHS